MKRPTAGEPFEDRLLTIPDVADYLACSPKTVRRMIADGKLKAYRYGRLIRIHPRDAARAGKPVTIYRGAATNASQA